MSKNNEFAPEKYKHFVWGENNVSQQVQQTYIIKLDYPACSIRFDYSEGMFASFEDFFNNIADVQFFTGDRPDKEDVQKILIDAWNFMALEEIRLDEDFENFDDEFDY